MAKHKHADLIHAWADGAEIEYMDLDGTWHDEPSPTWTGWKYRIKPEEKKPVVRWLWAYPIHGEESWIVHNEFFTEQQAKSLIVKEAVKLEWSRTEFPE
jgi:hypothetical protein